KFADKSNTITVPGGNIFIEAGLGGIDVGNLTAGSANASTTGLNAIYLNTSDDIAYGVTPGGNISTGKLTVTNNTTDPNIFSNAYIVINYGYSTLPLGG